MHVHPYSETFVLLAGHGRWTAGETVVELQPEQVLVVPAGTPHGLRSVGETSLLVVSVHESGELEQTFLGIEPARARRLDGVSQVRYRLLYLAN